MMSRSRGNVLASAKRWDGLQIQHVINQRKNSNDQCIDVNYYFDENLPQEKRKIIIEAINEIQEAAPGIQFNYTNSCTNFIYIVSSQVTQSYVGMIGGRQTLKLADWAKKGNAMHELMHALGFNHEHQREDRNKYVRCVTTHDVNYDISGLPIGRYDADSIMHYPTDELNPSLIKINLWTNPQRDHLSNGDKAALNLLYPPVKSSKWNPILGSTGLFYCKRHNMENNNSPFGKIGCDGFCGPTNGPNCPACRHYGGIKSKFNNQGIRAEQGETGLFYCGRKSVRGITEQGNYQSIDCGPYNGPNCESCAKLLD